MQSTPRWFRRPPRAWLATITLTAASILVACASGETRPEMTQQNHTIDYIEFTILDMAEAKRFYGAAFGWTFNDYGPEYAGIRRPDGDGEVGGMRLDTKVERGGPLVVLYSSDLDASLRAVHDAGGRIVTEPFDFPGGRRFHFTDPSGNELAVWSEGSG